MAWTGRFPSDTPRAFASTLGVCLLTTALNAQVLAAGLEWIVDEYPDAGFPYGTGLSMHGAFAALDHACRQDPGSASPYANDITVDGSANNFPARKGGWCLVNAPFIGIIEQGYYEARLHCNGDPRGLHDVSNCPLAPVPTVPMPAPNLGDPGPCNNGGSPLGQGNPIHIGTGNKFQAETDLVGAGAFPLRFIRYYNSHEHQDLTGRIGARWRHHYERQIHIVSADQVVMQRADGARHRWTMQDGWTSLTDRGSLLTRTATGWTYEQIDFHRETYADDGRLESLIDPDGLTQRLGYDANGRLETLTGPFGQTLTMTYADPTAERLSGFIDPDGNHYHFTYDVDTNLRSVGYPGSSGNRHYHYDDPNDKHLLSRIIDQNDNTHAQWAYDAQGRAVSSRHAGGVEHYQIGYNADGSVAVIDPLERLRHYSFSNFDGRIRIKNITGGDCDRCSADAADYRFDANGFIQRKTDFAGNVTEYTRDSRGRETRRTEALGTPDARSIDTVWHPDISRPTRISEPGRITQFTYFPNGRLKSKTLAEQP